MPEKLNTVKVPKEFESVFLKAEEYVARYFKDRKADPTKGTIDIFGQRYLSVRAASMSVEFFEIVRNLYGGEKEKEALTVAKSLLFDIAHAVGKADAKNFHEQMKVKDPIEKLSAGPIHFAYTGWAFVDIFPESKPTPDENYFLIYDHPHAFEADAWIKAGKKPDFCVCFMNAGYSSGWCEESFGVTLVASEIMCRARGDEHCRFIMAHPSKIEDCIKKYARKPEYAKKITHYEIPEFFARKKLEEALKASEERYRKLIEAAGDAIFVADAKSGILLNVNKKAEELLGLPRNKIIGMHQAELHPKEEAEYYKSIFKETVEGGKGFYGDVIVCGKNGKKIPVSIVATVVEIKGKKNVLVIFRDISERKQMEEALRGSEKKYIGLVQSVPDAIYSAKADKTGTILFISYKWKEWTGYSPKDCYKDPKMWPKSIHPEDREGALKIYAEAIKNKKENISEYRLVNKDTGEVRWVIDHGIPVTDAKGKVLRYEGTVTDITDRKKAEEKLKESEKRYRILAESIPEMIYLIGRDKRIQFVNPVAAKPFGVPPDELIGKRLDEIYDPETAKDHMREIDRIFETGRSVHTELYEKFPKLSCWVEAHLSPVRDEKGEAAAVLGISRDITKRKESEDKLRQLTEHLEMVMKSVKVGINTISLDGKWTSWSPYSEEYFGYKAEEIVGKATPRLVHRSDEESKKVIDTVMREDIFDGEMILVKKDGSHAWNRLIVTKNFDESGRHTGFTGLNIDVSERKKIEIELSRKLKDLERFQKVTMGREKRVIELKNEVKELKKKLEERDADKR